MGMLHLKNELRDHLIEKGLVEAKSSTALRPCVVDPLEGPPAPGDKGVEAAELVIAIKTRAGRPNTPFNNQWDWPWIEIEVRSRPTGEAALAAEELCHKIIEELSWDALEYPRNIGRLPVGATSLVSNIARTSWRYPEQGYAYAFILEFMVNRCDYDE